MHGMILVQILTRCVATWYGFAIGSGDSGSFLPKAHDDDSFMLTNVFVVNVFFILTTSMTSPGFFAVFLMTQPRALEHFKARLLRRQTPIVMSKSEARIAHDFRIENITSSYAMSNDSDAISRGISASTASGASSSSSVLSLNLELQVRVGDANDETLMRMIELRGRGVTPKKGVASPLCVEINQSF